MTTSVSLWTFTRTPRRVLPLLTSGDVLLTRRNGPALRLSMVTGETQAITGDADQEVMAPLTDLVPAAADAEVPEVSDAIDALDADGRRRDLSDPAAIELGALLVNLIAVADHRRLSGVLASACPWMDDLPPAARRCFVAAVAASAGSTQDVRSPADVLDEWRKTSQVFAKA